MCSVAPFLLPGQALGARPTMATTYAAEAIPPAWAGYGYYDDDVNADIDALLRGIDAVMCPPNTGDLPKPYFLAQSRRGGDHGASFNGMLRGIPSVRVPSAGAMDAHDATPTTPVTVLAAPRSYGDDEHAAVTTIKTTPPPPPPPKKTQQCGGEYDADIDATFRVMETDPAERPLEDYLSVTQGRGMIMSDRAELVAGMHRFSRHYALAPGTLHRAVSYVDRFLSAKKITGGDRQLRILGAVAVFAAAKYEDRTTCRRINADAVAMYAGCTRHEVLDAERQLVAVLGYRLSGPTAHTFVDHLMRHEQEEGVAAVVRALAHHLADMALLDYRCVTFLPSAVAASAIMLATETVLGCSTAPVEAGYEVDDLRDCVEAIYDMHENLLVWPGCAQMMEDWELATRLPYSLPPPYMLSGMSSPVETCAAAKVVKGRI
ncbi:unnamed protein product [Urochloa decumbens]|uniref:Cyclin N-terminal domain-containing protein n=1 Tax=Urochloa decumbens TaxID=240449 RepID=A0ABC8VCU1_9POAL